MYKQKKRERKNQNKKYCKMLLKCYFSTTKLDNVRGRLISH